MNALISAVAGVRAATARFDASAQRTAASGATGPGADPAREAVEQLSAKTDLKANLAVIRTADEMLGAVLDLKA